MPDRLGSPATAPRSAVLIALGRISVAEGDADEARARFLAAATGEGVSLHFPLAGSLAAEAAAGLAVLTGDPRRAAVLLGAAQALRGGPPAGPDATATATAAAPPWARPPTSPPVPAPHG